LTARTTDAVISGARVRRGAAILVNSHLLSEMEMTCDRVAVLRRGRVAASGSVEELTRQTARYKMVASPIDDGLVAAFRETGAGVERVNGHMLLSVENIAHLNALIDRLRAGGGSLSELSPVRATLEDVFVDLVRTADAVPSSAFLVPGQPETRNPEPGTKSSSDVGGQFS